MNKTADSDRELIGQVCFTITGEYITQQARNFVMEGDWQRAVDFLAKSFFDFPSDLAFAVCKGAKKLIGDSSMGIDIADDHDEEFEKRIEWLYAGYYVTGGRFYQPYATVDNYGENDIIPVEGKTVKRNSGRVYSQIDYSYRPYHYADDPRRDLVIEVRGKNDYDIRAALFKLVDAPPLWMREVAFNKPQEAFDNFVAIRGIPPVRGHQQWYGGGTERVAYAQVTKAFAQPMVEEEEKPEPPLVVDSTYSSPYGWISPDGDFYGCQRTEHRATADALCRQLGLDDSRGESALENVGWCKVTDSCLPPFEVLILAEKGFTQAQINVIQAWCEKHGKGVPRNVKGEH